MPNLYPSWNSYYLKKLTGYGTDTELEAVNAKYSQPVRYIKNRINFMIKQTNVRASDNVTYVEFRDRYTPTSNGIKSIKIKEEIEGAPVGCAICGSCHLEYITEDDHLIEYLRGVAGTSNMWDGYLQIKTGISTDGGNTYTYYPMGVYKVVNLEVTDTSYPGMERPKLLKIEAFDDIYFLNKEVSTSQIPHGSLFSIMNDCVPFAYDPDTYTDLQVTPSMAETLTEAVMFSIYTDTINIRDIVASRAAATGHFIKCDKLGQVQLCRPMIAPVHYNKYPDNTGLFDTKLDDGEVTLDTPVTGYIDSERGEICAGPAGPGTFDPSYWRVDNWYTAITTMYGNTDEQMARQIKEAMANALPRMEDHDQPYNGTQYYPVFLDYKYKTGTVITRGDPTWTAGLVIYFSETGNIEPTASAVNDLTNFYTHRIIISSIEFDLTAGMKATIESRPPVKEFRLTGHAKRMENVSGEELTLSDGTHGATITAQDAETLKDMAQYPRKIVDVPVYNKTNGLLVPVGTLNPHYHSANGLSITSESEYATEPCIVNLNLENVKQLRVVFQRNDGAGTGSYNSMGEFTIPLDYPIPNRSSRTTYGEWFIGGTTTITARDTNRLTCAMASVFYPTGGSLADCSFAFNDAWTLYGTARTSVSNLYVVAIYACY